MNILHICILVAIMHFASGCEEEMEETLCDGKPCPYCEENFITTGDYTVLPMCTANHAEVQNSEFPIRTLEAGIRYLLVSPNYGCGNYPEPQLGFYSCTRIFNNTDLNVEIVSLNLPDNADCLMTDNLLLYGISSDTQNVLCGTIGGKTISLTDQEAGLIVTQFQSIESTGVDKGFEVLITVPTC